MSHRAGTISQAEHCIAHYLHEDAHAGMLPIGAALSVDHKGAQRQQLVWQMKAVQVAATNTFAVCEAVSTRHNIKCVCPPPILQGS